MLLPALASLPAPLALVEVGAAVGLCLLPDRYAYDYGGRRLAPERSSSGACHTARSPRPAPQGRLGPPGSTSSRLCPLESGERTCPPPSLPRPAEPLRVRGLERAQRHPELTSLASSPAPWRGPSRPTRGVAARASNWPHSRSRSPPGALPRRVGRVSAYYRSGAETIGRGASGRNLTPVGWRANASLARCSELARAVPPA